MAINGLQEYASQLKSQGMNPQEVLAKCKEKFGEYSESQIRAELEGYFGAPNNARTSDGTPCLTAFGGNDMAGFARGIGGGAKAFAGIFRGGSSGESSVIGDAGKGIGRFFGGVGKGIANGAHSVGNFFANTAKGAGGFFHKLFGG